MLQNQAIFLTRLGTLRDPFEGIVAQGGMRAVVNPTKRRGFVHCWTLGREESELFWLAYGNRDGIAIKSTTWLLEKAIVAKEDRKPQFSEIKYQKGPGNWDTKTLSYRWEREYRVWAEGDNQAPGNYLKLHADLRTLVECVQVSPHAPKWLDTVVKDVLRRYGLVVPVERRPGPRNSPIDVRLYLCAHVLSDIKERARSQGCSLDEVIENIVDCEDEQDEWPPSCGV